jgi:hypothetical protein
MSAHGTKRVNETLKGGNVLLQVQLHCGCCEELGAKLNLCLDMKFRLAPQAVKILNLLVTKTQDLTRR